MSAGGFTSKVVSPRGAPTKKDPSATTVFAVALLD